MSCPIYPGFHSLTPQPVPLTSALGFLGPRLRTFRLLASMSRFRGWKPGIPCVVGQGCGPHTSCWSPEVLPLSWACCVTLGQPPPLSGPHSSVSV